MLSASGEYCAIGRAWLVQHDRVVGETSVDGGGWIGHPNERAAEELLSGSVVRTEHTQ